MRVTRPLAATALTLVAAVSLTGCFAGGGDPDPDPTSGEHVTLRLAHGWVGETPQAVAFEPAIEQFQADHPEIELEVETAPGNGIGDLISTSMAAGDEPDVFLHWGISRTSNYIEGGRLADLSELLEANPDIRDLYVDGSFRAASLGDGVYGLPINSYTHMFLYDEEQFDEAGVRGAPETVNDVIADASKLTAAGVVPISANGTAQRYLLQLYIAQLIGTPDDVAAYARGELDVDEDVLADAASAIMDMRAAGAFPQGAETLQTLPSVELYNAGQAASLYQDSWTFGNLTDEKAAATTVALPPAIDHDSQIKTLSSTDYFVYMSQKAYEDPVKQAAAWELMTYLAGPEVEAALVEKSGFPSPIKPEDLAVDDSQIPDVTRATLALRDEIGADATAPRLEEFFTADAAAAFKSLAEQLFTGQVTPDQFAASMADVIELNG
jgi:ABC-type glycerol-3-phosphate transport system substrate-binding protein